MNPINVYSNTPHSNTPHSNTRAIQGLPALLCTVCVFTVFVLCALSAASAAAQDEHPRLARAQAFLDQGQPAEALRELDALDEKTLKSGKAQLVRSTVLIMLGDMAEGYKLLKRALKSDPDLRQGWLNLAGLEIAERRYDEATKALVKARDLDPEAADSYLNLGAVAILQQKSEEAARQFATYLELAEDAGDAHYLVAANYALAGVGSQAVGHLRQAILENERLRLQARSDDRFAGLLDPEYNRLLSTDIHTVPSDHLQVAAAFNRPYTRQDPQLVYSVLEALRELGEPYDPKIEAMQDWALIWGDMRIKVWNQANGTGVVSLSAPPGSFSADDWHRRTQALFRKVHEKLALAEEMARMARPR